MFCVLIHNYLGVDLATVREMTQQPLPELKDQIEALLAADEESDA